jgi:hypothetical protein
MKKYYQIDLNLAVQLVIIQGINRRAIIIITWGKWITKPMISEIISLVRIRLMLITLIIRVIWTTDRFLLLIKH